MMLDSALSQIRVYVIAEQRQRIECRASSSVDPGARWQLFEHAGDETFISGLRALNRFELAFPNLEAVHVWLAKHEMPRSKGQYAVFAGYGRFNELEGTIIWSRRDLADGLREIAKAELADPSARDPRRDRRNADLTTYGGRRVVVTVDDGTEYGGVHVLWATEVVLVAGEIGIPFPLDRIVSVRPDPVAKKARMEEPRGVSWVLHLQNSLCAGITSWRSQRCPRRLPDDLPCRTENG
jgi:hypothetical protein